MVCRDLGRPAIGTEEHMRQVLEEVLGGEAFSLKGPRVTLKRWFSWVGACDFHDRSWHSRLLVILSIHMALGTATNYSELPLWGGPVGRQRRVASTKGQDASQQ
eukprot:3711106-Lingulodinium_polyedra.AAC.1